MIRKTPTNNLLMQRFRNGVLLEAEKRNMALFTMIKSLGLPRALQAVFEGNACSAKTMQTTADILKLDLFELLAVKPLKQKEPAITKRNTNTARKEQKREVAA